MLSGRDRGTLTTRYGRWLLQLLELLVLLRLLMLQLLLLVGEGQAVHLSAGWAILVPSSTTHRRWQTHSEVVMLLLLLVRYRR